MLGEQLPNRRVRCRLCARLCNIPFGKIGYCGVRKNIDGELFSLNYGRLVAMHPDPIEKKPLSHFHPGSQVFSVATVGCNFSCIYCQNYDISQRRKVMEPFTEAEKVIKLAKDAKCQGITGTYNEPTIELEYLLDLMKLSKKNGFFTTWVSNGYLTPEAVELIAPLLDAITIDLKGSGNREFYRKNILVPSSDPIFESIKLLHSKGVHIEITDLIVPIKYGAEVSDMINLASWILENLGEETPFHLLRFHPDYKLTDTQPTSIDLLRKFWQTAKDEVGLKHVYVGNVLDKKFEATYCPNCQATCIERYQFGMIKNSLVNSDQCPSCGKRINIIS